MQNGSMDDGDELAISSLSYIVHEEVNVIKMGGAISSTTCCMLPMKTTNGL